MKEIFGGSKLIDKHKNKETSVPIVVKKDDKDEKSSNDNQLGSE